MKNFKNQFTLKLEHNIYSRIFESAYTSPSTVPKTDTPYLPLQPQ